MAVQSTKSGVYLPSMQVSRKPWHPSSKLSQEERCHGGSCAVKKCRWQRIVEVEAVGCGLGRSWSEAELFLGFQGHETDAGHHPWGELRQIEESLNGERVRGPKSCVASAR